MVTREGQVKLLDFGIAKLLQDTDAGLTQTGVLYELLTGAPTWSKPWRLSRGWPASDRTPTHRQPPSYPPKSSTCPSMSRTTNSFL